MIHQYIDTVRYLHSPSFMCPQFGPIPRVYIRGNPQDDDVNDVGDVGDVDSVVP